jgi:hypothetical protein
MGTKTVSQDLWIVMMGHEADGVLKGLRVERTLTYDEINNFPGGGQYISV